MSAPVRIQRSRAKGWRMPPDTVYVGRPSRWGNDFVVFQADGQWHVRFGGEVRATYANEASARRAAVNGYCLKVSPYTHSSRNALQDYTITMVNRAEIQRELRGKNLACFCRLDQPCHADVLLEIANGWVCDEVTK